MTTAVSIRIKQQEPDRFRATAGDRQSFGRTMGEALDALMADWNGTFQEADVRVEPLLHDEAVDELHLVEVNGVWVVAGGGYLSPEDFAHDFVAEMYAERERSFYEPDLAERKDDKNPSGYLHDGGVDPAKPSAA